MKSSFYRNAPDSIFFVGTVEDNKDPEYNYRVKVRIAKLHPDSISKENLPWAARVDSALMGIGDEQDLKHSVPEIGTSVLVITVNGDANSLLYLGSLYKKTPQTPTNDQYTDSYGIYRKDGQFIGIEKINKIFKMLYDGDIEVNKINNISIKAKEKINIECESATIKASSSFTIDTPDTKITGNVEIQGNADIKGTMHSPNYDSHGHPYTWGHEAGAGVTSTPNQ